MNFRSKTIAFGRLGFLLACAAVVGTFSYVSIATGAEGQQSVGRESVGRAQDAPPASGATDFNISTFGWEESASGSGEETLIVSPGQSDRLKDCGSGLWEGSMLVLAPAGTAYCIEPIDRSDPESVAAARIAAMRLIDGGTFSNAELAVLRLQTLLGYAPLESTEARDLRDELDRAWEQLTPAERDHISNSLQ